MNNQNLIQRYGNMARYHAITAILPKTYAATYAAYLRGERVPARKYDRAIAVANRALATNPRNPRQSRTRRQHRVGIDIRGRHSQIHAPRQHQRHQAVAATQVQDPSPHRRLARDPAPQQFPAAVNLRPAENPADSAQVAVFGLRPRYPIFHPRTDRAHLGNGPGVRTDATVSHQAAKLAAPARRLNPPEIPLQHRAVTATQVFVVPPDYQPRPAPDNVRRQVLEPGNRGREPRQHRPAAPIAVHLPQFQPRVEAAQHQSRRGFGRGFGVARVVPGLANLPQVRCGHI